jgi:hypothetical protein
MPISPSVLDIESSRDTEIIHGTNVSPRAKFQHGIFRSENGML